MRVDPSRCLQCGTRARSHNIERCYGLGSDGSFRNTSFWFCSEPCYRKAIQPYISDQDYSFDRHFRDYPDIIEAIEEEAVDEADFFYPQLGEVKRPEDR